MTGQPNETIPEEPVWVKFSTGFKKELATLDGYALKVFLYIGLSVSFANGKAYPGLRKSQRIPAWRSTRFKRRLRNWKGWDY